LSSRPGNNFELCAADGLMQMTGIAPKKRLALAGNMGHSGVMETTVLESEKLRPGILQRIAAMNYQSS